MFHIAHFGLELRSAAFTHQIIRLYRREMGGDIQCEVKHFMSGSVEADREDSGPLHKVGATLRRLYPGIIQEVDSALASFHPAARGEVMADLIETSEVMA